LFVATNRIDEMNSFAGDVYHIYQNRKLVVVGIPKCAWAQTNGSQPFMVCGPLPKTLIICGLLLIKRVLQYHGRAICYLVNASACGPRRTAPWPPRRAEGSG